MKLAETWLGPPEVWKKSRSISTAKNLATSVLATVVRAGHGGRVRRAGQQRTEPALLVLYEMETCPFSRLVREALSELDLDCIIKPCPRGEVTHRGELVALTGEEKVPFLVDAGTGLGLGEASAIVTYLYAQYGDGRAPPRMLRGGRWSILTSKIAGALRRLSTQMAPSLYVPPPTIELYGFEGSAQTRLVREELGRLGVSHISRSVARGSARRSAFKEYYQKLQFPLLVDRETDLCLFDVDTILSYLRARYSAHEHSRGRHNGMSENAQIWELYET